MLPTTGDEGEAPADQDGVVGPHEATPTPQNSLGSVQAPHPNWATPPSQGSDSSQEGPIRYRTLNDLFDSTEELYDYE